MELSVKEINKRIEKIEKQTPKDEKLTELERVQNLPFLEMINHPLMKERLEKFEEMQKDVFEKFIRKEYPKYKDKPQSIRDLFAMYMTDFLAGKVKNMVIFMQDWENIPEAQRTTFAKYHQVEK